jgi:hypothetical protein
MNKTVDKLLAKDKEQLLRHLRSAVFYQIELWRTASLIEDTLDECQEGDWDAVLRLEQVRVELGEKIVDSHDVSMFTAGLGQPFRAIPNERQKAALRQQLQKALWIQNELWKTAGLMAQPLSEPAREVVRSVTEFSIDADSGCELVESDLDFFLGTVPRGPVKQGHWELTWISSFARSFREQSKQGHPLYV